MASLHRKVEMQEEEGSLALQRLVIFELQHIHRNLHNGDDKLQKANSLFPVNRIQTGFCLKVIIIKGLF